MAEKTNDIYVTTGNVNVRVRPTYDSPIVRTVEAGAELEIEKTYSRPSAIKEYEKLSIRNPSHKCECHL